MANSDGDETLATDEEVATKIEMIHLQLYRYRHIETRNMSRLSHKLVLFLIKPN